MILLYFLPGLWNQNWFYSSPFPVAGSMSAFHYRPNPPDLFQGHTMLQWKAVIQEYKYSLGVLGDGLLGEEIYIWQGD